MSYDIVVSDVFRRSAKSLSKKYPSFKKDLAGLVEKLSVNPKMGTPLGGNLFKIRISIESKGTNLVISFVGSFVSRFS